MSVSLGSLPSHSRASARFRGVGRLLHGLKPKQVETFRILDPACGLGSFLIRACQEVLDYYQKRKAEVWEKRREALLRHIFGVDLDPQAVEVTKLSLMLKLLEGELGIIPGRAVLPVLDRNIKCGNSLISGDRLTLQGSFGPDLTGLQDFDWRGKISGEPWRSLAIL